MRRLRWLMCALVVTGSVHSAAAADFGIPFLRGSNAYEVGPAMRWDGLYFGAQVGTTIGGTDFGGATSGLRNMLQIGQINSVVATPFGAVDHSGRAQYGGFIGYNVEADGAVLGVEGNYSRLNTTLTANNTVSGTYVSADGVTNNPFTGTGTASVRFTDYGSLRLRGGWAAGNFMPYATVGFAVAQADLTRTVTANFTPPAGAPGFVFPAQFAPLTMTETRSGIAYGYSLGAGLDFALSNCFFLRAEYEYASFGDFNQVGMHLHNVRVAGAYKF
jgi:opacity protein-like surface antigen